MMTLKSKFAAGVCAAVVCVVAVGCATTRPEPGRVLKEAQQPAWSLKETQDEMVVAASPVRKTLQFAGSTGLVIGASVDAVVNAKYRDAVRDALAGYDPNDVYRTRLEQALNDATGGKLESVAPMGSTAGFQTLREAQDAYEQGLARAGHGALLELRTRYGLYGTEAELVVELDGELVTLPQGKRVWERKLFVVPRPALASDKAGNPLGKKRTSESAPQFRVDEDAFALWTANGGEALRSGFEQAVDAMAAAVLEDLGLAHTAQGQYQLGRMALSDKEYESANKHFLEALRMEPGFVEARNAQSVAFAGAGQLDEAIAMAKDILQAAPDFAPAAYNLAWWYAVEKGDAATAKPYYEEAQRLGMAADRKIEEALGG